jgi:hypothetical protein
MEKVNTLHGENGEGPAENRMGTEAWGFCAQTDEPA